MRFTSTVSQAETAADLSRELTADALPDDCDLAVLFLTGVVAGEGARLAADLREVLRPGAFLAVTCEGVIGAEQEVERTPGAALLCGSLPGVQLRPWRIGPDDWRSLLPDDERLRKRVGAGSAHRGQLVLADPFTTPVDDLLQALDTTLEAPTFGGMASGAQAPGGNRLILDDESFSDGAIGLSFGGPITIETVVSQGCRPIGRPAIVTRAEGQFIVELGKRPALEVAEETLQALPESDRELLSNGLFVGVAIDEYRPSFGRGDFLVRGLMGVDRGSGALAVGDMVRAGQTVQFHVRDADTAHEDLVELLRPQGAIDAPAGGLLFSCNGRGTRMFPEPHHDAQTAAETLPGVPLAGFFAMGELGPVGGKSFIHGHTASVALFRPTRG